MPVKKAKVRSKYLMVEIDEATRSMLESVAADWGTELGSRLSLSATMRCLIRKEFISRQKISQNSQ